MTSTTSPVCLSAENNVLKELSAGQVLFRLHSSVFQVPPDPPSRAAPSATVGNDHTSPLLLCLCSEGNSATSTVAYYQSQFEVHVSQQASLDQAVESLQLLLGGPDGRQGRLQLRAGDGLSVSSVMAQGLTPPHDHAAAAAVVTLLLPACYCVHFLAVYGGFLLCVDSCRPPHHQELFIW